MRDSPIPATDAGGKVKLRTLMTLQVWGGWTNVPNSFATAVTWWLGCPALARSKLLEQMPSL